MNATHWSTRTMAGREAKLSQTAIGADLAGPLACSRIAQETFKLSTDPLFVEKTRDMVGLSVDPPLKAHGALRR